MSLAANALKSLQVINRLEVGPIRLEPRRLIAPYKIFQGAKKDSIDLIYRFDEDVFDPAEASSKHLASMIAAQIALNYGLFCKEIVFQGHFDKYDQCFLEEMAKNTAREIFVKKFLEPNPFIRGDAASIPPVKAHNYLLSRISFDSFSRNSSHDFCPWETDPQRCAVLSSGGKDSLLSFGLLNELGYEAHPVFINESGRHWFTALNTYRYFRTTYTHSARVWTNSDRVFTWMLRHLPFIRKDFASIRSDEYPVRLWTVAVFLFGALPLLRKRGINHLIIGNEYDTTRKKISSAGITHYDGLYDQSRYFDNTLTRYFQQKGWGICQFSILRNLSEILIQKILVERYPHLQEHQISCHAATLTNGRVYPCGKCEKCRRIVVVLTAMGADPAKCGYTPQQVEHCLNGFLNKPIHQEYAGAQHLAYLLIQKGILHYKLMKSVIVKERPEVMKIRIDADRSPVGVMPVSFRKPLFDIFLKYAGGAVQRNGRLFSECDLTAHSELLRSYPFESLEKTPQMEKCS
jgi:7-cyano-7-deazaguanine synthase in queuosine biosynthesis